MLTHTVLPCAIIACLALCACEEDSGKSAPAIPKNNPAPPRPRQTAQSSTDTSALLDSILAVQNRVVLNPADALRQKRCAALSFDSTGGGYWAVGKGIRNDSLAQAAQMIGWKRASEKTAQRWLLYKRMWSRGTMLPYGSEIEGSIAWSHVVSRTIVDDTLFTLLQAPQGSIAPHPARR
ncbi:MAG: hypothetical protein GF398_12995 [Chitinivibrionales bacterium]|nr:hypothetical protein [Chitinivibrionales bacterium]